MLTKVQLEFIRASLTAQNSAVPTGDGGNAARVFVSVLDELDAQLKDCQPKLASVPSAAHGSNESA